MRILIVENNFENGINAIEAMRQLRIKVELVSNVEDALKEIDKNNFLAVLSKMNLPLKKKSQEISKGAGKILIKKCTRHLIPSAIVAKEIRSSLKVMVPEPIFNFVDDTLVFHEIIINKKKYKNIKWQLVWSIFRNCVGIDTMKHTVYLREKYRGSII